MHCTSSRHVFGRLAIVALFAAGVIASGLITARNPIRADDEAIRQANQLSEAFRQAAKQVLPTVVKIQTTTRPPKRGEVDQDVNPFKGTPFEDFFDEDQLPPGFRFHRGPMVPRSGVGSGVIIDASGIIVTNNHVVEGADEVTVELSDGRQFKATDIKRDKKSDLAVLRIEADDELPAATLGDSDRLEIGDWVIAAGTPFELDQTVSAGIISAKGRMLGNNRAEYLQTDAAINPGNSGGPLVNLDGEVVGINTAIASRSGGYQGIGFAVTSNTVSWVAEQLIESGEVRRAYLGVGIRPMTAEFAEQLGVRPGEGVLVAEVFDDSPAAEAGIEVQDIILKFAGKPVGSTIQLQEVVERCPLDSKQKVEILRDGKSMTLDVVLKAMPKSFDVAGRSSGPGGADEPASYSNEEFGLVVSNVTPEIAKQLGLKESAGVVVTEVDPAGLAAEAGLRETAVILRVGRTPVADIDEFEAAIEKQPEGENIMLLVRFNGGNRFLILKRAESR